MTRTNGSGAQRPHHYFTKIRTGIVAASLLACLSNGFAFTTFGSYDCGQWFTKREVAKSWLLGLLSGLNFMVADEKKGNDPLSKLGSADQAFLWMDNYCRANPLKSVTDGGIDLYIEIQMKK
ncbi:hypothetical protein QTI17_01290 [Variovorax sp. J31P179]|uniref:hypothetical protein n=1 Tax=Variovorax sp. J31P179 TaxID=3053508 RepID=UPI0025770DFE|nr:hypothetical protein [Variovorax sp. J31P179]MDM0079215.1 hypothetical protein [Variovorax sp. J31P179]